MRRLLLVLGAASALFGWELKQNDNPNAFVTYDEATAYCKEEPGWRLPTVEELFRLVHDNHGLIKHTSRNYWAKTEFFPNHEMAWQVLNPDRDVKPFEKSKKLNALCVPDTPVKDDLRKRYELKKDMIIDLQQNLYWQKIERKNRRNKYNHLEAAAYCASLDAGGFTWRLPTLKEMFNIIEFDRFNPVVDKSIFRYTYPKYYWTADQLNDFSNEAYVVGFKVGSVAQSSKVNKSFVRCVSEGNKE